MSPLPVAFAASCTTSSIYVRVLLYDHQVFPLFEIDGDASQRENERKQTSQPFGLLILDSVSIPGASSLEPPLQTPTKARITIVSSVRTATYICTLYGGGVRRREYVCTYIHDVLTAPPPAVCQHANIIHTRYIRRRVYDAF